VAEDKITLDEFSEGCERIVGAFARDLALLVLRASLSGLDTVTATAVLQAKMIGVEKRLDQALEEAAVNMKGQP
jgi:hypothetical protein